MPAQLSLPAAPLGFVPGVFAWVVGMPVVSVEVACASARVGEGADVLLACEAAGVDVESAPQAVSIAATSISAPYWAILRTASHQESTRLQAAQC